MEEESRSPYEVLFLILAQVLTKGITFFSNQFLVRSISPEVMGVTSLLEFYVSFSLFISRESERLVVQRVTGENKLIIHKKIINIAYVPFILATIICSVGVLFASSTTLFNLAFLKPYSSLIACLLIALIFIELASEPLYAISQYNLDFKTKSAIESSAILFKCFTTFISISLAAKYADPTAYSGLAVVAFALGQLAYSLCITFGLWRNHKFEIAIPGKVQEKEKSFYVDPPLRSIWITLFFQMLFKIFLTEGDRIMMGYLFKVNEQGMYAVISNYGSLIARLLFLPIEEMLRNSFTKNFTSKNPNIKGACQILEHLLAFYIYFTLLLVLGGFENGSFLLRIVLGKSGKWGSSLVFDLFPRYLLYLPFMAFNGALEAFQSSISDELQIKKYSYFMVFLSMLSFLVLYHLVKDYDFGLISLIIANIFSMLMRIAYCTKLIFTFFSLNGCKFPFKLTAKRTFPAVTFALLIAVVQGLLIPGQTKTFREFFISVLLCFILLFGIIVSERKTIRDNLAHQGHQTEKPKDKIT